MARFKNFSIWRGRLPHWRAEDVNYFVTFRHKRELDDQERRILYAHLLQTNGRKLDIDILCVLPSKTDMVFRVRESPSGEPHELSDVIEKAKGKAGKQIVKKSGERWPPFYFESYDRIIRDESEYETTWTAILESPVDLALCDDPEAYETLYVFGSER